MNWAAGLGVAPAPSPADKPEVRRRARSRAEEGQQGRLFSGGSAGEVAAGSPAPAAPAVAAVVEAAPPSDILGRWKITTEHVTQAVKDWVLAHRTVWPLDPSPGITARERKMIRDLVSMFGPEVWGKMCAISCTSWAAIRDEYRVRARKPELTWVYAKRNDLAAAAARGGSIVSRSNRGTAWKTGENQVAETGAAEAAPAARGRFGW